MSTHMNRGQMEGVSARHHTQVMTSLLLRCSRKETTCLARMQGACGLRKQESADNNPANQPLREAAGNEAAHTGTKHARPHTQAESTRSAAMPGSWWCICPPVSPD
jgi:hypothetical protein